MLNKLCEGLTWLGEEGRPAAEQLKVALTSGKIDYDDLAEAASWIEEVLTTDE